MKQQIINSRVLAALALVLTCGSKAWAWDTHWTAASGTTTTVGSDVYGNWTSPGNWSSGIAVDASMNVFIDPVAANGGRVIMNNGDSISPDELWVGGSNPSILPKMHSLTISGGILQHFDGSTAQKTIRIGDGATSADPGVITQTGGTFFMNKGEMRIGANVAAASWGLYNISGGTFSTAGGLYAGGNVVLGSRINQLPVGPTRGELRISGNATVNLGLPATVTQALGFGRGDGTYGSSVLSVIGSAATINIDSIQMVNAGGVNSSLINFEFDQTGVSTIHIGRFANLALGFLNVNYTGTPLATGQSFDLMVGDQITLNSSFNLDPSDTADWQLAKIGTGLLNDASNDILRLTYIAAAPEPTGLSLLGVGLGVVLLAKRRRE